MSYSQERLLQVLLAPQISEKATSVAEKHEQVVFRVASDATKPEIKAAVELLFKVQVDSVQVLNVKGKVKRFGRSIGQRKGWKKAFVCLKPGQEINFVEGGAA
ncbi:MULTISPECIES: 50S ribosomal protein L23 [unclassified Uliginosibacterium]|uniref:50S ribosomal protein L23 n=1 Tax=unclassified Uliginosibacterium TaxID=2621521 RepID=UPI000C7CEA38|nr:MULTISPECIES: 50S ribosomal protein L23 [unclassified Uliginosibacterium]MDO6387769.1 50S ribosomal protein L23 [Uliginosibacterium sp. 31-12]PLK49035.1 50S ribosomal protein L23 [Uliginosibacterium sp. TH139]